MQKNLFHHYDEKYRERGVAQKIQFLDDSELDDEMYFDDSLISFEKDDQNYLCQVKDEALCQIIKLQTIIELK